MKKLLIVYPNQFGYHTDTYKYCEHLSGKFDIYYVCFDQGFEKMSLPGVTIIYCNYNSLRIIRLIKYFAKIISASYKIKFDVIFTVQFKYSFIIGILARANLKILDFRTGDLSRNGFIRKINNGFLRFDSLFFKRVTVISHGLQKTLKLNKKKTSVIPLGADIISTLPHDYDQMNLLYVGVIKMRNIYQTVEGLGILINRNPHLKTKIRYNIVGFGPELDIKRLQQVIEEWNLQGTVIFHGRVKYTDLKQYFDRSNIGISYIPITPYYEHQPATKTYEYVLSGLYTIATNTYENRKVINENNGMICKDSPESFAETLSILYNKRNSINEFLVRDSLKEYFWGSIVNTYLLPLLNK